MVRLNMLKSKSHRGLLTENNVRSKYFRFIYICSNPSLKERIKRKMWGMGFEPTDPLRDRMTYSNRMIGVAY